jgi:hypothetical protein
MAQYQQDGLFRPCQFLQRLCKLIGDFLIKSKNSFSLDQNNQKELQKEIKFLIKYTLIPLQRLTVRILAFEINIRFQSYIGI